MTTCGLVAFWGIQLFVVSLNYIFFVHLLPEQLLRYLGVATSAFVAALWLGLIVSGMVNYWLCHLTCPGFAEPVIAAEDGIKLEVCQKCKHTRPPRAHHCKSCKRCVVRMDHHCWWLDTCVGLRNYHFFLLQGFYHVVAALVFFLACLVPIRYTMGRDAHGDSTETWWYVPLALWMGLVSLALMACVALHVRLISHRMTTIEYIICSSPRGAQLSGPDMEDFDNSEVHTTRWLDEIFAESKRGRVPRGLGTGAWYVLVRLHNRSSTVRMLFKHLSWS